MRALRILLVSFFTFAVWKPDTHFFWRDEWTFMAALRAPGVRFFVEPYNGHFAPAFKLLYWIEMLAFGTNALLFVWTSLLLFAATGLVLWHIGCDVLESRRLAGVVALAYVAHPVNFNHLLWTALVCVVVQVLLQCVSVGALLQHARSGDRVSAVVCLACLFAQNFFFGNGILMPLALLVGATALGLRGRFLMHLALLQLTFVVIQLLSGGGVGATWSDPAGVLRAFARLSLVTISRALFFSEDALGWWSFPLAGVVVTCGLCLWPLLRSDQRRRLVLFGAWFGACSAAVPAARPGIVYLSRIPQYYSGLSLLPLLLCGALLIDRVLALQPRLRRPVLLAALVGVATVASADQRLVNVFAYRNFRNQEDMRRAVELRDRYRPFDDPYFSDSEYRVPDVVDVYQYWQNRTHWLLLRSSDYRNP